MPKKLCNNIDKKQRGFWWSQEENKLSQVRHVKKK